MLPLVAFFYFNPRSHERSDKSPVGAMFVGNNISIHAPTRGATSSAFFIALEIIISIHAPTRGATFEAVLKDEFSIISIHAPTRGATDFERAIEQACQISIHAPTRGATAILHKKFVYFYTIPTINI